MQIELFTLIAVLDPSICEQGSTTGQWAGFTWRLLNGLNAPTQVLPILIGIILLPWLIRPFGWKRHVSGGGLALLLTYLIIASPIVAFVGNWILEGVVPSDSGAKADAIVVLGRGEELRPSRVDVVAHLWRDQRAPLIFASGYGDALEIADMLVEQGVARQAIDGEPCSRTTEENARFTVASLQPKGVERIVLVTDPPHMLRSLLTFHSLGVDVIPHPSPLPNSINRRSTSFLVVREYLGLVSYGLLGRFLPRELPNQEIAQTAETATATSTKRIFN